MKQFLKTITCSLLYYSGAIHLFLRFWLQKRTNLPVIILIYHRIAENIKTEINQELSINHPLKDFKREMGFLKKWFNVVTLDKAVEFIKSGRNPGSPTLTITFDDGFEDNFRLAYPILKELNLPATIFLTTGAVETNDLPWLERVGQAILHTQQIRLQLDSHFNDITFNLKTLRHRQKAFDALTARLKQLDYFERIRSVDKIIQGLGYSGNGSMRMLSWQEILQMSKDNIDFGAHTLSHPILSRMPLELAKREILASKLTVEEKLGVPVKHFAFPNGRLEDFNDDLKYYCKEIGFESISTAVYGNNPLGTDVHALKRLSPGRNMPIFVVDLLRGFLRRGGNE